MLVLLPIGLTWLGLRSASDGYHAAVATDPQLLSKPFLLLWEEGFDGHGNAFSSFLTLSTVALLDVVLIGGLLLLTGWIHLNVNVAQAHREARARNLEERLRRVAWRASTAIATHTSQIGVVEEFRSSAAGLVKEFRSSAASLVDEIRAERERIQKLADERDRTTSSLGRFAKDLKAGADDLRQAGMQRIASSARSRTPQPP